MRRQPPRTAERPAGAPSHRSPYKTNDADWPSACVISLQLHYLRNLLTKVPKSAQPWVATLVRTVFDQPDADAVRAQFARVVETIEAKFPAAAEHLDGARAHLLAFTGFPREIWRQIWSNNPQERLNKEIRRRTDVVGIFPNRAAIIRLVGAVLAQQNLNASCQGRGLHWRCSAEGPVVAQQRPQDVNEASGQGKDGLGMDSVLAAFAPVVGAGCAAALDTRQRRQEETRRRPRW
jgi:hypothetical protein